MVINRSDVMGEKNTLNIKTKEKGKPKSIIILETGTKGACKSNLKINQ